MQVLITGSAGFIGYHLAKALARQGIATYGIDSINSYYDVSLKKARLKACGIDLSRQEQEYRSTLYPNYTFRQMDLCDKPALDALLRGVYRIVHKKLERECERKACKYKEFERFSGG